MAKLILQDVRCSYVFVREPRKNDDGTDGAYSIQVLIPKSNKKLVSQIQNIVKDVHTEKFPKIKKAAMLKLPLRDGDAERDEPEYEGMYFMNANSARKPGIVNRKGEPADPDDLEELCFSGAYFHVSVNFYGFDRDGSKGVAVGLNNLMLRKKGERLDGSISAESEFEDFASEDDFEDDEDDLD